MMSDGTKPYLAFRELRKYVNGRKLLDIACLDLYPGVCVLLSGKNGTGKTTLLKIIAGLEAPDSVKVFYQDQPLAWRVARNMCRRDTIYLHQQPYLFDASVFDNVAYGLRRAGKTPAEVKCLVERALDLADLTHLARRHARALSGGEKQRVALTRALVLSPRLLLLDEPVANLDEESRARTYFLIQRIKSERINVIITGHELMRVAHIGDTHWRLENGMLHPVDGVDLSGEEKNQSRPRGASIHFIPSSNARDYE